MSFARPRRTLDVAFLNLSFAIELHTGSPDDGRGPAASSSWCRIFDMMLRDKRARRHETSRPRRQTCPSCHCSDYYSAKSAKSRAHSLRKRRDGIPRVLSLSIAGTGVPVGQVEGGRSAPGLLTFGHASAESRGESHRTRQLEQRGVR